MKHKNEAGYTLVLVLLTITLIFIFSLTIISNVLNSATQNNTIEKKMQLQQSSQMGVTYMEAAIVKANNQAKTKVDTWLKAQPTITPSDSDIVTQYHTEFDTALKSIIGDYPTNPEIEIISNEPNKFRFKISNIKVTAGTTTITVKYVITPSYNNEYGEKDPVREKNINIAITQPS